ncbi:MAG: response regulator [Pseudomonadota bacterium]
MEFVKKILAVDDDLAVLEYLQAKLGGDYTVITTHLPSAVLSLARQEKPDLIICDIDMPGADGGDVAASLAGDPATRSIPILYLTAILSQDEARDLGGIVGGRPGISKHAPAKELVARIRSMIPG